jgi:hypothetical protein
VGSIETIEGIGVKHGKALRKAGIRSTSELLKACGAKKGRKALAAESGCTETLLLEWVNRADLMRIRGVGEVDRWVARAKELDAMVSH